jgi:hypothetical protein
MAKNQAPETSDDRKPAERKTKPRIPPKHKWPKALYPLEPTSIPPERIMAAVDKVIAARVAAEKAKKAAARKKRNVKAAGRV